MKKKNLPVIILKGLHLLPCNDLRVEFESEKDNNIIEESLLFHDGHVLVITKIDIEENIIIDTLPSVGVVSKISHKIVLPNGKIRVTLNGLYKANVVKYLDVDKKNSLFESIVSKPEETKLDNKEERIYVHKLKREVNKYIEALPYASNSILSTVDNTDSLYELTNIIPPYLQLSPKRYSEYMYETNETILVQMILDDIYNEIETFNLENEIDSKVKKTIDENQKTYLLREKIKAIKEELGDTSIKDDDVEVLRQKITNLKAKEKVKDKLYTELARYESLTIASPEISIIRGYIDTLLSLPWDNYTLDNDDLFDVRKVLDESHSGLDEVKMRIIEFLAVRQMTNSLRSPIICLVGPPGVGKTSLAFSIARAMHRNFVKISVGGVTDEAELVGHRRTYLGANPGRIIQSLKKAKSSNPVFLIDEIDKMAKSYKGDPASVLLEILDPEQNHLFSDNYIEEEYDLSKVLFITTANYIEDIPEALKDRLEVVELSGYTEYEKLDIAKKYLLPKICREHGVNKDGIVIKDNVLKQIIECYTKESGVRELERQLATIVRKIVTSIASSRIIMNKYVVDLKKLESFLGKPKFIDINESISGIGVVNGLAYTKYGGDILHIEVGYFKGNGKLILSGSVGEVMRESALVALDYIKANSSKFGIDYNMLTENDIHIHIPSGAVKKEGPSAGIALTTAIISAFTKKKIKKDVAFTGEITLLGHILKIGGLKEKSIGALHSGIKKIFIPFENQSDIDEFPDELKNKIEFIAVKDYTEVVHILWDGVKNG